MPKRDLPGRSYAIRTRHFLKQLAAIRDVFGAAAARERVSLIRKLARRRDFSSSELILFHDLLCFARAYPDNTPLLELVERELRSFGRRVVEFKRLARKSQAGRLDDTGIDGTRTTYQFNLDFTAQLLKRYPGTTAINWKHSDKDLLDKVESALALLVAWEENDPLDNDEEFDIRRFLTLSGWNSNRLAALANLFSGSGLPANILQDRWEDLGLLIDWDLTGSPASRTLQRVSMRRRFYQTEPYRRRTNDLLKELRHAPPPLTRVGRQEGQQLLDTINEGLAIRNRELYPLTYGNPNEVYTVDPGRGVRFVLYGTLPSARLPLEANFGALLVRNGMPVGYGVAAVLFDRAEIAINIFPTFRGAESTYFFEQFINAFYWHFGSRVFVVRAKQMGYGEDEALFSGAFWFYYKLGFRAVSQDVRQLAEREYAKIQSSSGYRVPTRTMRKLSKSDVLLTVNPSAMSSSEELSIINLGYRVTEFFGKYQGNRLIGTADATARLARALGIRDLRRWSDSERLALVRLAPLFVQIPDLSRWSRVEKQLLVDIIRAKGGPRELAYVRRMNEHQKLKSTLGRLAK